MPREILSRNQPFDDMQLEAVGAGHAMHYRIGCPCEHHRNRLFMRLSLPDGHGLAIGTLDFSRCVFTPTRKHGDAARFLWNEEAQAHRRGKETLLRGLALFVRLLSQARRLRDLTAKVVVLVGVGTLVGWRTRRDQEAGQVPVRGAHPARQSLLGECIARTGTDEIQLQRLDEPLAYFQGRDGREVLFREPPVLGLVHDATSRASRSGLQIWAASRR